MSSPSAGDRLLAARNLFQKGDSRQAERELRSALDDARCAAALREYLVAEGRMDDALEISRHSNTPVDRVLQLHATGDFAGARDAATRALDANPQDASARLHQARALHNLGERRIALEIFRQAVEQQPDFAEGWYALAHALRAGGDLEGACTAYQRALELSPGLRTARMNLGITLSLMEDAAGALEAFEVLLARDPDDLEALLHSAAVLQMGGELGKALERLQTVQARAPDHPEVHRYLGSVHNELGHARDAVRHLERALALNPGDPDLYADLAGAHELSSHLDQAADAVARGLAAAPGHPQLQLEAARLERRRGEAARALERLQRIDPGALPARQAQQYFHEVGLSLDRAGQPDPAIQALETANRIAADSPRARAVDRTAFFRGLDRMQGWLDRAALRPTEPGGPGADLCFMVGFPRSGTTLLDTMLGAHPDVASIEEQPTLEHVIARLEQTSAGYPNALDEIEAGDLDGLRAVYRQAAARHLPESPTRMVLDKMPLRLLETGLIRRLFPGAKVLFVRRHPCDVVLSNFMQLYEPTEALVHCDSLAGTVHLYDRVIGLWPRLAAQVEGGLDYLCYEDLVEDPEAELERICRFLGLSWSTELAAAMLDPQARARSRERIRTTSYQQVGEQIYRRAAGRWTRYRRHLEPFLATLEPHARAMGYAMD